MIKFINENRGQRRKTFTLVADNLNELEVFISCFLENSEYSMFDFTCTPFIEAGKTKMIIAPIGKAPLNVHYTEIKDIAKSFNK